MTKFMRVIAMLLAVALLLPMVPGEALATESAFLDDTMKRDSAAVIELGGEDDPVQTETDLVINPLYEGLVSEEALGLDAAPDTGISAYSDSSYYTEAEAAEVIREYMKARTESFTVSVQSSRDLQDSTIRRALVRELVQMAVAHTGVPNEGDYLRFQYGGYQASYGYRSSQGVYYLNITYTLSYYTTAEQEAEMDELIRQYMDELIDDSMSSYQKVCAIYDFICDHVTYDYDNLGDDSYMLQYTAYAALKNGTSVCQGYANLFYRMALEAGLDARIISGTGNGGGHAWNIVKLGHLYYNLDATWDAVRTVYRYFLKADSTFQDHTRNAEFLKEEFLLQYPMATEDCTGELPPFVTYFGRSLSLEGLIYLNKYVTVEGLEDAYVAANGGLLIWNAEPEKVEYGTQDTLVEGLKAGTSGGKRIFGAQTPGIYAKQYADELYIAAYIKLADGSYIYSEVKELSVRDYCLGAINSKTTSAALKETAAALLNYGAAVQAYRSYNLEDEANAGVTYTVRDWNESMLTALVQPTSKPEQAVSVEKTGNSLSLEGEVNLNFYFKPAEDQAWTIRSGYIQVWNGSTTELTEANVDYTVDLTDAGANGWGARTQGFVAREYGKTIYARACVVGSDGVTHYSDAIPYSVESYVALVLERSSNAKLQEAMKRLTIYGQCAEDYKNSK